MSDADFHGHHVWKRNGETIDHLIRNVLFGMVSLNFLIIIGLGVALYLSRNDEFQPFKFQPQTVLNRIPNHGSVPAAWLGDPVVVRGEKCNTSKRTFTTHSTKAWTSVSPPGNTISFTTAGKEIKPGCKTKVFINAVPPAVLAAMTELLKKLPYVVWQITGTVTAEVHNGATRSWHTEPFYIYKKGGTK